MNWMPLLPLSIVLRQAAGPRGLVLRLHDARIEWGEARELPDAVCRKDVKRRFDGDGCSSTACRQTERPSLGH